MPAVPAITSRAPFRRSTVAASMFIAGLPMNPPTNMLSGRS
jgi:hypothetical protein